MTPEDVPVGREAGARATGPLAPSAAVALVLVLFAFGTFRAVALRWVCDDAFISIRYADNLASGRGLVYNAGEYVEGYTNFLWTVMLAIFMRMGLAPIATAHVLSILAYVVLAFTLGHRTWRRARAEDRALVPLAAALTLSLNDFHVWATGGLETMMFTSLVVLAVVLTRSESSHWPRPLRVGCLLSLALLSRPDAVLFAGAAGLSYWVPLDRYPRSVQMRNTLLALTPVLLTAAVWLAWKQAYYGEVLPTAFYSKSVLDPYYSQGLVYVGLYLAKNWFVVAAPFLLVVVLALTRQGGSNPAGTAAGGDSLVFLGAGLLYLVYVTQVGGDFMFARRLIPVMPFFLLVLEDGVNCVSAPRSRWPLGAVILLMAAAPFPLYSDDRVRIRGVADEPRFYPREVVEERRRQGEAIGAALEGLDVRVAFEGGLCGLAYYSRLPYLVETTGLTQYSLARLPLSERGLIGHEKAPTREWYVENGIQFLIRHDRPRGVARSDPSRRFNDIIFGGIARGSILLYSDRVMDALRQDVNVSFVPIERVIADVARRIETSPPQTSARLLAALEDYYLRQAGSRGERETRRLRDLASRERTSPGQ